MPDAESEQLDSTTPGTAFIGAPGLDEFDYTVTIIISLDGGFPNIGQSLTYQLGTVGEGRRH